MNKKRVVFDVGILSQAITGDGSGIFYTALNLFEKFIKNENIDVVLYSSQGHVCSIQKYLQKLFDKKFECLGVDKLEDLLFELKLKRRNYKAKHQYTRRLFFDMYSIIIKIVRKLRNTLYPLPKPVIDGDIYFSPNYAIPSHLQIQKKYIFLHDTIPLILPEYFSTKIKTWFDDIKESIDENTYCFTNSEATKKDFLKYWSDILTEEKIVVSPLAAADTFHPITDRKKIDKARKLYRIPEGKKYVFSLCTLEPRKNLIRTVRTFIEFIKKNNIDDLVFVLGGGHWKAFIDKLNQEIKDLGNWQDKIIQAGYIADEDLATLYSGAEWFVYTSQYEGFGLPPLEAMKCGTAVITSNNSSLPEVVGDAAQTITFDDDEAHIKAYEKYYFDENYKNQMAQKGLERSKQFSWQKTAEIILNEILK